MPPRASTNARGLLLSLGAIALVGGSMAGGWWLGQRNQRSAGDLAQVAVERQADQLRQRLAEGSASEAEQQRLVQLLLALNQQEEATALLEQLADQQPQRWQLRLLLAELHRNNNNRSAAERELRQLLNLSPNRIEALQLMALLQFEQGRGSEAQAQLKAQIERASKPAIEPQVLPLGLLLGDLQQRMGQKAAAAATYTKLAAEFPPRPPAAAGPGPAAPGARRQQRRPGGPSPGAQPPTGQQRHPPRSGGRQLGHQQSAPGQAG